MNEAIQTFFKAKNNNTVFAHCKQYSEFLSQ